MSRQSDKIVKGAHEYLESGEEVLVALVAAARGHTQAGLQIASPIGVALT